MEQTQICQDPVSVFVEVPVGRVQVTCPDLVVQTFEQIASTALL